MSLTYILPCNSTRKRDKNFICASLVYRKRNYIFKVLHGSLMKI